MEDLLREFIRFSYRSDARTGGGYGITGKYNKSGVGSDFKMNSIFPYKSWDEFDHSDGEEEPELDADEFDEFNRKTGNARVTADRFAGTGTDKRSFADSSNRLHAGYEPDGVVVESSYNPPAAVVSNTYQANFYTSRTSNQRPDAGAKHGWSRPVAPKKHDKDPRIMNLRDLPSHDERSALRSMIWTLLDDQDDSIESEDDLMYTREEENL